MGKEGIIVVTIEVLSLLFLGIILYSMFFENKKITKKSFWYILCVVSCMFCLVVDIPCWTLEYQTEYSNILWFLNYLGIINGSVTIILYGFYHFNVINDRVKIPRRYPFYNMTFGLIAVVVETVLCFTKGAFYIDNAGKYIDGDYYFIVVILCTAPLLYLVAVTIKYWKKLGAHDALALCFYMAIPLFSFLISTFVDLPLSYLSTPLALILIFVMLQSSNINEVELKAQILKEYSFTDALTGLNNRRAYDEMLETISKYETVCVMYLDVNNLKWTNDKYGHKAGDALIIRFANMMLAHFPKECLYRVGGDEFVMIAFDRDEQKFDQLLKMLEEDIAINSNIASLGHAYGYSSEAIDLINQAEEMMYNNKNSIHSNR